MLRSEECRDCEYHNSIYGCMKLGECPIYQDIEVEKEIDRLREEKWENTENI